MYKPGRREEKKRVEVFDSYNNLEEPVPFAVIVPRSAFHSL